MVLQWLLITNHKYQIYLSVCGSFNRRGTEQSTVLLVTNPWNRCWFVRNYHPNYWTHFLFQRLNTAKQLLLMALLNSCFSMLPMHVCKVWTSIAIEILYIKPKLPLLYMVETYIPAFQLQFTIYRSFAIAVHGINQHCFSSSQFLPALQLQFTF